MASQNPDAEVEGGFAKYRTKGGAEVVAFERETQYSHEYPYGWVCKGCQDGTSEPFRDPARRFADEHAQRCNSVA